MKYNTILKTTKQIKNHQLSDAPNIYDSVYEYDHVRKIYMGDVCLEFSLNNPHKQKNYNGDWIPDLFKHHTKDRCTEDRCTNNILKIIYMGRPIKDMYNICFLQPNAYLPYPKENIQNGILKGITFRKGDINLYEEIYNESSSEVLEEIKFFCGKKNITVDMEEGYSF